MDETLQLILSLVLPSILAIFSSIVINRLNKSKLSAETKKVEAEAGLAEEEKEKTASGTWRDLALEWEKRYKEIDEKTESRFLSLEEDNRKLKSELEVERLARIRLEEDIETERTARLVLEEKFKKIRQWLKRNAQKMEEAKIEPIPVEF